MIREINRKLLKKNSALVIALNNFDRMDGVENLFWNLNHLMESIGRVGLILVSTMSLRSRIWSVAGCFQGLSQSFTSSGHTMLIDFMGYWSIGLNKPMEK